MTREEARKMLVGYGITEPNDDQISNLLNTIGAETKREKDKADNLKKEADRANELQKQLDALNEQNLSDIDKANRATETANNKIADLEKQLASLRFANDLATIGIVGEDAQGIIDCINKNDFGGLASSLGKVITARETASATAKERELLKNTPNPSGNGNGTPADDKSNAEKLVAELFGNRGTSGSDTSILSHYTNI